MKLNSLHLLMSVVVFLLLLAIVLIFTLDKKQSVAPINTSQTLESNKVSNPQDAHMHSHNFVNPNGFTDIRQAQNATDIVSHSQHANHDEDFDFSKYITDEAQIEEIRALTNRSTEGLVVEELPNDNARVNLQGRFRTVNVAVVDEHGVVHRGEWAPPQEKK